MKPVELIVAGIKCDAPGCDYIDPDTVADERYVDTCCPKCGSNLLTESDWKFVRMLTAVSDWASDVIGSVPDDAKFESLRLEMDGSGLPAKIVAEEVR